MQKSSEGNGNKGKLVIPQGLLDWKQIKNINAVYLYVYLLISADTMTGSVEVSIRELAAETGISVQRVRTILNLLERDGLITHISTQSPTQRATRGKSVITICNYGVYIQDKIDEQHSYQHNEQHSYQHKEEKVSPHTPFLKEGEKNKKKIFNKLNIKEKQKDDFVAPELKEVFDTWLKYKQQMGKPYKSSMSRKICYGRLTKLSRGDPQIAMMIVEQSMANNWAGLFELKEATQTNSTNNEQQYNISDPITKRLYERGRRMRALAERLAASQAKDSGSADLPF